MPASDSCGARLYAFVQHAVATDIELSVGIFGLASLAIASIAAPYGVGTWILLYYAASIQLLETVIWAFRWMPCVGSLITLSEEMQTRMEVMHRQCMQPIEQWLTDGVNALLHRNAHARVMINAIEPRKQRTSSSLIGAIFTMPVVRMLRGLRGLFDEKQQKASCCPSSVRGLVEHLTWLGTYIRASPFKASAAIASLVLSVDSFDLLLSDQLLSTNRRELIIDKIHQHIQKHLKKHFTASPPPSPPPLPACIAAIGPFDLPALPSFTCANAAWLQPLILALAFLMTVLACSRFVRERAKKDEYNAGRKRERLRREAHTRARESSRRDGPERDDEEAARLLFARKQLDVDSAAVAAAHFHIPSTAIESMMLDLGETRTAREWVHDAASRVPCDTAHLRSTLDYAVGDGGVPIDMLVPYWYQLQQAENAQAKAKDEATYRLQQAMEGHLIAPLVQVLQEIDAAWHAEKPPFEMIDSADRLLILWSIALMPLQEKLEWLLATSRRRLPAASSDQEGGADASRGDVPLPDDPPRERDHLAYILYHAEAGGVSARDPLMQQARYYLEAYAVESCRAATAALLDDLSPRRSIPAEEQARELQRELEAAQAARA